jgi:hypothetical protein
VPELEDHQRPHPRPVHAALQEILPHGPLRPGIEAFCVFESIQAVFDGTAPGAGKPAYKGEGEGAFWTLGDFSRQQSVKGLRQQALGAVVKFNLRWYGGQQFYQHVIEERRPDLQ